MPTNTSSKIKVYSTPTCPYCKLAKEFLKQNNIPYENMWADDKYWLPLLLSGRKFRGNFHFNEDLEISHYELNEVNEPR